VSWLPTSEAHDGHDIFGSLAIETLGMGSEQNEFVSGGLVNVISGHRRIPPINIIISGCHVVFGEDVNMAFMIQFSSQRIVAAYHWLGVSLEGHPSVRQATWS
jgi:hypothetical protein